MGLSPMTEIVDPWILDPEGFFFKFEKKKKTEGFWGEIVKCGSLRKPNNSFAFSHFFAFST